MKQRNGEMEKQKGGADSRVRLAFIFPGQGSQYVGMGKESYDNHTSARRIFEEASDALGFDMAKLCFEGPVAELNLTKNTQPALLTASIAMLTVLRENLSVEPCLLAGHSLGEYTALVAGGALEFRDAVRLVERRGRFMQEAVPEGAGAMAAVLGLTGETVKNICDEVSGPGVLPENGVVVPANFNSNEQTVISGDRAAVEKASVIARDRGAIRVIPLPVSVPSHSPLMKQAAERLSKELDKISVKPLLIPVVTNVEAKPLSSSERVRELLVKQLYSPVRWVESIQQMKEEHLELFVEIGPGRVLTGLVKRIESGIKAINIEKTEDIKQLADENELLTLLPRRSL